MNAVTIRRALRAMPAQDRAAYVLELAERADTLPHGARRNVGKWLARQIANTLNTVLLFGRDSDDYDTNDVDAVIYFSDLANGAKTLDYTPDDIRQLANVYEMESARFAI